jgi:glycosyltransferase 2 family protein
MANRPPFQVTESSPPLRRWAWRLLSYGVGLGCLYWVFHDIRFGELLQSLARIAWWWVPLAIVLDVLVYVCAAWEWQILLRPVGHLSLRRTLQALFVGRFANDVLPVHAGYVVRVYLAARWLEHDIASILPSLLIERLFDALWLALGIGLTTMFFPLTEDFARSGEILGALILVAIAVVAWTIIRKERAGTSPQEGPRAHWKLVAKGQSFVQRLAEGLRSIGRSQLLLTALGLSILKLLLQGLSFLALLQAYDFPFPFRIKLAVFLIAYIGLSMPSTPAALGVFQFICAAGLVFFGVPKAAASGFALLAYVALTAPLAIAGFVAAMRSGLTWHQVRHEVGTWKAAFSR